MHLEDVQIYDALGISIAGRIRRFFDALMNLDVSKLPFPSLNFNNASITKGIRYAHDRQCKVVLDLEVRIQPGTWNFQRALIDHTALSGVDAISLSDPALMLYGAARYPELNLHYATPESALSAETIKNFQRHFDISRAVPAAKVPPTTTTTSSTDNLTQIR